MRKIIGLILVVLMVVSLFGFVRQWRGTTASVYGTGDIGGNSADRAERDPRDGDVALRSEDALAAYPRPQLADGIAD